MPIAPMKDSRTDTVLGAMIDRDRERKLQNRKRYRRFHLRTLMGIVIVSALALAAWRHWGNDIMGRIQQRTDQSLQVLPGTPVSEVLPPLTVLGGLILGTILACVIYRLDAKKSFLLFGGIVFFSLVAFVCAISMEIEPFRDTELRDVSPKQVLFASSISLTIILPISALAGWYLSGVGHPNR